MGEGVEGEGETKRWRKKLTACTARLGIIKNYKTPSARRPPDDGRPAKPAAQSLRHTLDRRRLAFNNYGRRREMRKNGGKKSASVINRGAIGKACSSFSAQ